MRDVSERWGGHVAQEFVLIERRCDERLDAGFSRLAASSCSVFFFFFSSRRRHTRCGRDWSSDVCSSDLRVVALAGPGDVVGALTPGPLAHQSGALALSGEVSTRVLPAGHYYSATDTGLEEQDPEFATLLANAAGEQIQRLTWALEDSAHPVPARVARALLRLGQRFGHHTADGAVRLTLPVTHETLASLVGAARETTTYTIQQLRKKGLLVGTRGHYHFEPVALERYAHEAALAAR